MTKKQRVEACSLPRASSAVGRVWLLAMAVGCVAGGWGCAPTGGGLLPEGAPALEAARAEVAEQLRTNPGFEFEFDLVDVSDQPLRKADFRGRVLIVDIWGTWCPPCRQEIPTFVALHERYGAKGLAIVGLSQERGSAEAGAQTVRAFRKSQGIVYPCGLLTRPVLAQVPDFVGYPTTLFFDRMGNLRLRFDGYHDPAVLQGAVETLLAESPVGEAVKPASGSGRDAAPRGNGTQDRGD